MDSLIEFFIDWGYVGLFLSALVAGSIVPFSSEAVMVVLIEMGLDEWGCGQARVDHPPAARE